MDFDLVYATTTQVEYADDGEPTYYVSEGGLIHDDRQLTIALTGDTHVGQ